MENPEEPDDADHEGALQDYHWVLICDVQNPHWIEWRGNVSDWISVSLKDVHEEWTHLRVIAIVKLNSWKKEENTEEDYP